LFKGRVREGCNKHQNALLRQPQSDTLLLTALKELKIKISESNFITPLQGLRSEVCPQLMAGGFITMTTFYKS
jgi:hypothetical protein